MFMIDASTISAFLTGSLATLFIREIFNQINKRVDFTRDLRKITYQRKLDKAESAVAYYYTYISKAIELKKSMETVHKALNEIDETKLDIEIISQALSQNSSILQQLSGDKYFDINAVHLYFDLENTQAWSEEDIGALYECIAEMKYHDNDISFWASLHNSHLDKQEDTLAEKYWSEMKNHLPLYLNTLENFISLLEKNKQGTALMINTIKTQLKA